MTTPPQCLVDVASIFLKTAAEEFLAWWAIAAAVEAAVSAGAGELCVETVGLNKGHFLPMLI
jgi:hypothetical protein